VEFVWNGVRQKAVPTSPWSSGKCVRFGAGRSFDSRPSLTKTENWYCSLLTRRTVCGRAVRKIPRTQNKPSEMKPEIVQTQSWGYNTSVVTRGQQQTTISKSCSCLSYNDLEIVIPWLCLNLVRPNIRSKHSFKFI